MNCPDSFELNQVNQSINPIFWNWIELHLTHLRHKFQWHWECGQVRWLSSHSPPCCYYCKAMEALSFVARCCRCYLDWWGDLAASWSKPTEMGASIVPLNWSMHVHVHETIGPYFSFDFDELDELFEALEAATFQISLSMDCLSVFCAAPRPRPPTGSWEGHEGTVSKR